MPIREYRVLAVSPPGKGTDFIMGALGSEYDITSVASGGDARRRLCASQFDIVIVNAPLCDEFGGEFALFAAEGGCGGVILIVRAEIFDEICGKVEDSGVLTVSKPVSRQLFHQTLKLAVASAARI